MRRLALLCTLAVLVAAPAAASAQAPEVALSRTVAAVGEPIALTIQLDTPAGAVVELDPAAATWGDIRVIRVLSQRATPLEDGLRHRIEALVAPFAPGSVSFRPAVVVTSDSGSAPATLPALTLEVPTILVPGEPLTLSALPPPVPIDGARSPFLWPGIGAGAFALALLAAFSLRLFLRWWGSRPVAQDEPALKPAAAPADDELASAGALLDTDTAGAYRAIASAVRRILGERYAFPAQSLTTAELETRMTAAGVDGWEERMARELLRECDAVVYAGYRPAPPRRVADLRIAREIVRGSG